MAQIKTNRTKITLHMVCSLDGYIAKNDGSVDWMVSQDVYDAGVTLTEKEISDFLASVDCYVMGSHTYEHALELGWPYGDTPVFVLTSRVLPKEKESITFYSGELKKFVQQSLSPYSNIWMVGGSQLTRDFLQLGLADEIVLTIIPILLGNGLPFFEAIGKEIPLHLKDTKTYSDGMVELTYEIKYKT